MSNECDRTLVPPPPPPLPNLSVIIPVNSFHPNSTVRDESEEIVLLYIAKLYRSLVPDCTEFPSNFMCTHIKSLIQDGPTCGLVALSMISSLTSNMCSISYIFDLAHRRGFTKKGEMFSAANMTALASEVLGDWFDISHYRGGIMKEKKVVTSNLLSGNLYLIPYDSDKNHAPANLKGLKAHWAILCGVLLDPLNTYVLAKQSKSRRIALWDINRLHESNMNLREIAVNRINSGEYVLDDIEHSLAGNYILFRRLK